MYKGLASSQSDNESVVDEGLALIKAFLTIPHRRHRDAVVALAQALGCDEAEAVRDPSDVLDAVRS